MYKPLIASALIFTACTSSTMTQQQALDFLYSYMPLPDRVDYDSTFFKKNIEASFIARQEMPWGDEVPEREFRHFVLPVRVNNENMDYSRSYFYNELKDRVKGLSMADAILEVNHWCHEHVTYQPSDERTSSPMATLKTAFGRCGEESTFTVAALRSVCIPARQVYTPRWAHTDDNHAWVEAWADGKWHFLGACEPEAVLDLGWFNAPASRGMLMHTKAFGHYVGPEEVMSSNNCYTEINVTANYAPVGRTWVKVVDEKGKPVRGADVEYKIYNYAEFYTVARRKTNLNGISSLEAGLGDLLVWAAKDDRYGFKEVRFKTQPDTTVLVLDKRPGQRYSADINIVPPAERNTVPEVSDEQKAENTRRLAYEDSIRAAYVATFDTSTPLMTSTRGNHHEISRFLQLTQGTEQAMQLLDMISEKDLRDVTLDVLTDCLEKTPDNPDLPLPFYYRYVLNPRVANEMLTPHRAMFAEELEKKGIESVKDLLRWINKNIHLDTELNPQNLRMTPAGVWRNRRTDVASLGIFFVAACRSMGIAARIDPVTQKVQYALEADNWRDISFTRKEKKNSGQGTIMATYSPTPVLENPRYYSHFSLSALKDGFPVLMNYEEDDTYQSLFDDSLTVDAADYMLVTGTRLANGSVLAHVELFPVEKNSCTTVPLVMRSDEEQLQVIGSLNSENLYEDEKAELRSILATTGRGYYVIAMIAPGEEPTNHILRDISACKDEFEKWGRTVLLLFRNQDDARRFNKADFPDLPSNVVFGIDTDGAIAAEMPGTLPVVKIADTFNRVVFSSEGYTISLGETLMKAIKKL